MKKIILAWIFCFFAVSATAETTTPRQEIERITINITKLLRSPEIKNPATKEQIFTQIETELNSFFAFQEFSSRAIGRKWKTFNKEQKDAFQTAFTDLLRNTYIDTLNQYTGQTLEYVSEKYSKSKKRVEVQMAFKANNQKYPVAFRMINKNGTWAVYDVIIEGISMIKNYREQFRTILATGSPEDLILRVQKKVAETKEKRSNKPSSKN